MRTKRAFIIIIILVITNISISILQSCCNPDDVNYTLESLQSNLYRITGIKTEGEYNVVQCDFEEYTPDDKGIRYDSLGIEVSNDILLSVLKSNWENFLGFNGLYACEPAENYDRIFDVEITSSEDYNAAFPKGSDLSKIMSASWMFSIQKNNIDYFLIGKDLSYDSFLFTFNFPPDENKYHDITIKYTLYDSREFSTTIENVLIKK